MTDDPREILCATCGCPILVPADIADDAEDGYVICASCALANGDLKEVFVQ